MTHTILVITLVWVTLLIKYIWYDDIALYIRCDGQLYFLNFTVAHIVLDRYIIIII